MLRRPILCLVIEIAYFRKAPIEVKHSSIVLALRCCILPLLTFFPKKLSGSPTGTNAAQSLMTHHVSLDFRLWSSHRLPDGSLYDAYPFPRH